MLDGHGRPAHRVLLDDGQCFAQHSGSPTHVIYGADGTSKARLRVQRVFSTITKAQVYFGDNTWSDVEDFSTRDIVFDGGADHGWPIPV